MIGDLVVDRPLAKYRASLLSIECRGIILVGDNVQILVISLIHPLRLPFVEHGSLLHLYPLLSIKKSLTG